MKLLISTALPTRWGPAEISAYGERENDESPYLCLAFGQVDPSRPVMVRVHSECFTGDVFGSRKCECGDQLDMSCKQLAIESGVLIYARQEGRGIGLVNKLKAYKLQDQGLDTAQANEQLGFPIDMRTYEKVAFILKDMGIKDIRLMTNNPDKLEALEEAGFNIVERIPVQAESCTFNMAYLRTKRDVMGHLLDLEE